MEMSIDEAILYMELYKRKLFDSVSDIDKDIEAYDIAIDIMCKYQKIEQIYKEWFTDKGHTSAEAYTRIGEVLKGGNTI